ncbi:MAG: S8 family serine peptidase [Dermatophilaceae bacterium]
MALRTAARTGIVALLTAGLAWSGSTAAMATDDPGDRQPNASKPVKADTADKEDGPVKDNTRTKDDKLGEKDRALLTQARAKGEKTVTLIMATTKGTTAKTAAAVKAAGGTVGASEDSIGYVRATVPTANVEKVAANGDVLSIDLNELLPMPDPRADLLGASASATADAGPGPSASTPDDNPYMPTRDIGAVSFRSANPTWDGRGVTIGVLDSGVALDHPALQTTTTGEPKIVDWVTATDPLVDGDLTWRAMLTAAVPNAAGTFSYAGSTWTAPAGATALYVNRFTESVTAGTGSELGGDVNRDGDTTDRFGVLYSKATNDIWVDVNQDFVFDASEKMRPFVEARQFGYFGTDNPATPLVERMPFVVEFRKDVSLAPAGLPGTADFVNIGIVSGAHGSHVAGIAAGHSLFGGAMNGAAPGAKVVSSRACVFAGGCTAVALTEGMIDLVLTRKVDIVNLSIGGLPALNDGHNARADLYNTLIDDYGVQIVISAGNSGPGINTIGDPSVATSAISAASSITKETWAANYGAGVSAALNLHNYSSRGPREDGGFKPNISAPGSAISSVPLWQAQSDVAEVGYKLPVGYAMFNGTSMAAPQTTGGAALLLSAAKANGWKPTTKQLRESMYSSALLIKDVQVYAQGNGQFSVPGAWNLLKAKPEVRDYVVSAPVCTAISAYLTPPNQGTGLYNDCPQEAGGAILDKTTPYQVTVTRTSGPTGNIQHKVRIVGANSGTFEATETLNLGLNKPQKITVRAHPESLGVHSAIVQIDAKDTALVDARFMAVVVESTLPKAPTYAVSKTGAVERNRTQSMFVTVPPGTGALQVNLGGVAAGSQTRFIAFSPYGVPVESTSSLQCYTNFSDPAVCNPTARAYTNPIPGVWEIEVESRRTSPLLANPYSLTASLQGVTVTPATVSLPSVATGVATPVEWTVTNNLAPVTLTGEGGPLASTKVLTPTINQGELHTYEVVVPAGTTKLSVSIGNTSDRGADLDLYVYGPSGALAAQSADGDSEEAVSITNPAPGTYTVEVDGYTVAAGGTTYDYRDAVFSPALGSLAVTSPSVSLATGQSTTITGTVTALMAPEDGRQLSGVMVVRSAQGAILGQSVVLIGSVTP